ncbi:ABC transporter substrate-binding protein [Roseomonas sp. OT10]|uniref:ABC transporter substrate-binding protein n=1 Tax=Roseomonas cutis TaxID=2897332 RepID=UPI001E49B90E|nr:ABC transporter substrate-binding protein [Roseomonas sp. OT10]UFN47713.1 ABC transporter substrate-binding protein [Roseomonas sp. OT10]
MRRRTLIASAAATLAAPRIAGAQRASVLRFVPQSDLALLDPVQTTAAITRNHGLMVFDQLYGVDANLQPQPQMAEGHTIDQDGKRWTIRLREGLRFHDGEPVRARDCAASVRRWGKRDTFGLALMAATDEIETPDDRTLVFRLKRPFPLLADALGKSNSNICVMMPERLAQTDPSRAVPEMIGSGPYRFVAGERVAGAQVVYERFRDYAPRPGGEASFLAGPRRAHFDRVEWRIIPDAGTAAAALQSGEVDWWEQPAIDLLPLLRRNAALRVDLVESYGFFSLLRPNHLHPPFDNPAIRKALLGAFVQADFMQAVVGDNRALWKDNVGFFLPGSPMASDVGLSALPKRADFDTVKRDLQAAGYKGERVVFLVPTDFQTVNAMSEVAGDALRRSGINLDYQAMDWGTALQRLASQEPLDKGGWSLFSTWSLGAGVASPAAHAYIRGSGRSATFGWFGSDRMEALRNAWLEASDLDTQKRICRDMQALAFEEVPFYPTGFFTQATALRSDLTGLVKGAPLFWGIRRG